MDDEIECSSDCSKFFCKLDFPDNLFVNATPDEHLRGHPEPRIVVAVSEMNGDDEARPAIATDDASIRGAISVGARQAPWSNNTASRRPAGAGRASGVFALLCWRVGYRTGPC